MRRIPIFMFVVSVVGHSWCAFNPFNDGATADVRIIVKDEAGNAVPEANVGIMFGMWPNNKGKIVEGTTDDDGAFATTGKCTGEMSFWASKDGYYDFKMQNTRNFRGYDANTVATERRWSSGSVEIPVLLKKIQNPINLESHDVDYKAFPATNDVLKLDLELLDWCPPYGNGKHDDVHMMADVLRAFGKNGGSHYHLNISFPNCMDGFYRAKKKPFTTMPYDYKSNENAHYEKELVLRHIYVYGEGSVESIRIPDDEYLMFRVRTVTNEVGQIIHAHYGRIDRLSQILGLTAKTWFNPSDMDTNLESSEFADAQRKRDNRKKARSRRHLRGRDFLQ